jgi:hypothetical protein
MTFCIHLVNGYCQKGEISIAVDQLCKDFQSDPKYNKICWSCKNLQIFRKSPALISPICKNGYVINDLTDNSCWETR